MRTVIFLLALTCTANAQQSTASSDKLLQVCVGQRNLYQNFHLEAEAQRLQLIDEVSQLRAELAKLKSEREGNGR